MEPSGNLIQMLTGFTVSVLTGLVYSTFPGVFLAGGKFRSKVQAIVIVIITALGFGLFTPVIDSAWRGVIEQITELQVLGVIILVTMFTVNQMVPGWRHTTPKSLVIYGFSLVLIFSNQFIK